MEEKKLTLVNLEALQKLIEDNEKQHQEEYDKLQKELDTAVQQYNQVVQQNKDLQSERNIYIKALQEIKELFYIFQKATLPFHVGKGEKLPHRMANEIEYHCELIQEKINEVFK